MKPETLYISPLQFAMEDTLAIQSAVNAAAAEDIQVVSVSAKPDGSPWHLTAPVVLPSYMTVIVDGAVVEAEDVAFRNANAHKADKRNLAGEQHKIFLLGRNGGTIRSLNGRPVIVLDNCRDCRIADLELQGSVELTYFRYGKVQQLKISHCRHGVIFREGCSNIILESLWAHTEDSAIVTCGGSGTVMGRDNGIYNSIFCRIQAKTAGAPAVQLRSGVSPLSNIVLRDVTDETVGGGASVVLGAEGDSGSIRDLTVRGVSSNRDGVRCEGPCDGCFFAGILSAGERLAAHPGSTRCHLSEETLEIVLPRFPVPQADRPFVTPNMEGIMGQTDSESIQNAVDTAAKTGLGLVVIPRWNVRTQQAKWELGKVVRVPSDVTVVFLQAYLRLEDFCYCNMFANSNAYRTEGRSVAFEEHDLTFTGIGDAVLDGGIPNGLLEKTCFLYGLPDKRHNATMLFNNVRRLVIENLQLRQARWYNLYFIHCDTCRVSNIDLDNHTDHTNRDGVDIRSGCHNFLVENITGTTGDDTVALNNLGNDGNDGRYVEGKDRDTKNMIIRNVKADAAQWFTVRLLCQDRNLEHDFTLDTIMDVSTAAQKRGVGAAIMVGSNEYHYKVRAQLGDLAHLTIRDVYCRSRKAVAFDGYSDDVSISNVHVYGEGYSAIAVGDRACVRDVRVDGVFYRRSHVRLRDNIPANQSEGIVISLPDMTTESLTVSNVYAESAKVGVLVSGKAHVTVDNFSIDQTSYAEALCAPGCELTVNGEAVEQTPFHFL